MSGKSTRDNEAILTYIKSLASFNVKTVVNVMDFEAACWKAFSTIFPLTDRKGCHFHWTQALWRKVQDLGLAVEYNSKLKVKKFIRRLFALPFLPSEHILPIFNMILQLQARIQGGGGPESGPTPLSADSYYGNYIKTVSFWGPAAPC